MESTYFLEHMVSSLLWELSFAKLVWFDCVKQGWSRNNFCSKLPHKSLHSVWIWKNKDHKKIKKKIRIWYSVDYWGVYYFTEITRESNTAFWIHSLMTEVPII